MKPNLLVPIPGIVEDIYFMSSTLKETCLKLHIGGRGWVIGWTE